MKSVDIPEYEESLHECDIEEPNLNVDFDHFVLTCSNYSDFVHCLRTSSFSKKPLQRLLEKLAQLQIIF